MERALPDLPFPGGCSLWPQRSPDQWSLDVYELRSLDDSCADGCLYNHCSVRCRAVLGRRLVEPLYSRIEHYYEQLCLLFALVSSEKMMPALSLATASSQSRAFSLSADVAWAHRVLALSLSCLCILFSLSLYIFPF